MRRGLVWVVSGSGLLMSGLFIGWLVLVPVDEAPKRVSNPTHEAASASLFGDYKLAAELYRMAADQGDALAQANLGVFYEVGRGVEKDYVQAYKWYSLAAAAPASNPTEGQRRAATRDNLAAKMTPAQIEQAEKLIRDWKPKK